MLEVVLCCLLRRGDCTGQVALDGMKSDVGRESGRGRVEDGGAGEGERVELVQKYSGRRSERCRPCCAARVATRRFDIDTENYQVVADPPYTRDLGCWR